MRLPAHCATAQVAKIVRAGCQDCSGELPNVFWLIVRLPALCATAPIAKKIQGNLSNPIWPVMRLPALCATAQVAKKIQGTPLISFGLPRHLSARKAAGSLFSSQKIVWRA